MNAGMPKHDSVASLVVTHRAPSEVEIDAWYLTLRLVEFCEVVDASRDFVEVRAFRIDVG